ncbi:protein FAR1-RELATED SEQUENCE 2-like [Silene latifolia]|uniref:protein FAR1-RELATED SEQUENCE 2-like n=1 Tax=Silene latifolia TaxID=37657 RepID=UPI003D776358
MGQKEPQFLITDQCPGIKKAFPSVFKQARHRYCMCHITQKISGKVGSALCKDTDFLNRFNTIVWDSDLELFEFEDKWQQLISDFQLEDNDWLSTMFTDRKHWIPSYHRDLPMGCILITTQRSMFQELVKAAISFGVAGFDKKNNMRIIFVEDVESNITFKVTVTLSTTDAKCACKLFEKIGLLCRHIVWVYKSKKIWQIPSKYILDRCAKNSHATNRLDPNGNVIEDSNMAQSDNRLVCKLWAEFSATVGVLKNLPPAHMDELASLLVEFREKLSVTPLTKDQEMEMLLGCSSSSEVLIWHPVKAHKKGSGKDLTSAKTQAIEKAAKPKSLCAYCMEKVDHDKRTCPLRIAKEAIGKHLKKCVI